MAFVPFSENVTCKYFNPSGGVFEVPIAEQVVYHFDMGEYNEFSYGDFHLLQISTKNLDMDAFLLILPIW